jgi:hypothetical protein
VCGARASARHVSVELSAPRIRRFRLPGLTIKNKKYPPPENAEVGDFGQDSKRDITKKHNKFKFSYRRRAREILAFVARIVHVVVLYKLKMQYHAHPSAITLVQRA